MSTRLASPAKRFMPVAEAIPGQAAAAAAAIFGESTRAMATPTRRAAVARARQFAVYLNHVALGESLSTCARLFNRDRATVRHACARIEDMRDEPHFDFSATVLEKALIAHRDLALALVLAMHDREATR